MATSLPSHVEKAFEIAKSEFLRNLKRPNDYDFSKFSSIDDVYDTTEKIQEEQNRTGNMRHLSRIKPYLEALSQYIGVLDTFSQVKSDISSLIWGPIKLLLQVSSTLVRSYDKIIDAMGQIGDRLPQFQKYTRLFKSNDRIQCLLSIFYRDILDFHVTALNFFKLKSRCIAGADGTYSAYKGYAMANPPAEWNLFFESLWPKYGNKITIIMANIDRHTHLMIGEVTLTDIVRAQEAREQAIEKYIRDEEFQRRQDFESVKQSLLPKLYDDKLEGFRKRRFPRSGEWLESDDQFSRWLDPKNTSQRLFWLQGKTMLSSSIIDKTQHLAVSNTLFAFLSYRDPHITTVKIFQSFIFQLLLENPDLQPILSHEFQSNFRKLSSDTTYVRGLLTKLLQIAGFTCVIVDGLDEIEETERQFLLRALLEVHRDCEDMKLLISSRAEDDITRLLQNEIERVRVDKKNVEDIRTYVQQRADEWLASSGFDVETSTETRRLLVPLASKANGMILYARLVMDSLSFLSNLHDIQEELSTLPGGLDQAYGRILKRINEKLTETERKQVRKVLGWVGCSKLPMRKRELEAALAIRQEDRRFSKSHRVFLNIPRLCGPILEIESDVVQFVHFTAKQYLFGPQTDEFLKRLDWYLDISKACVRYLSFECFEIQEPDEIETSIFSGDYVLLNYAATQWLDQVKECAEVLDNSDEINDLCQEVEDLVAKRQNLDYEGSLTSRKRLATEFKAFQKNWPELCETLTLENSFWTFKAPLLSLNDGTTPCTEAFLSIFIAYGQIHRQFDLLLCKGKRHEAGCRCQELQNHYGQRLYKCDRLACKFHRFGFETDQERDSHIRAHDRPFKCPDLACQYADMGFKTENTLRQHIDDCHKDQALSENIRSSIQDIEPDQLEALLTDAVTACEVEYVRRFLPRVSDEISNKLYVKAVATSTSAVVELFINSGKDINKISPSRVNPDNSLVPLIEAVAATNVEVAKFLLDRGCDIHKKSETGFHYGETALDCAMSISDSEMCVEMIHLLIDHGVDLKNRCYKLWSLIPSYSGEDSQAIKLLELFKFAVKEGDNFSHVLKYVSKRNCSIDIAKFLLRNGADVNTRGGVSSRAAGTPLYFAANNTTVEAAELMKFLLESGADPFKDVSGRTAGERPGARNISKWLGITWDELVESTAATRADHHSAQAVTTKP